MPKASKPPKDVHHIQARCSAEVRSAIMQLAEERGVKPSEVVRDLVESALFGQPPGSTMSHPDQGYRIAKSTARVIASKALQDAISAMPDSFEEFKALMERGDG